MRGHALAVLALALLAGCAGLGAPSTETSVTPAPVPTPDSATVPTPESAPSVTEYSVAPGVSAEGVEDPDLLIRRHIAVASNTSFVSTARYREAGVSEPSTYRMARTRRIAYDGTDAGYRYRIDQRLNVSGERRYVRHVERYGNATVGYARTTTGNLTGPNVGRTDAPPSPAVLSLPNRPISHFLRLENETVREIDRGEREHVLITGTRRSIPDHGILESLSARVVVREDGLIRRVNVSYVDRIDDGTLPVQYTLSTSNVGNATVRAPAWVAEARAGT